MEEVNLESLVVNGSDHVEPVETEIGLFHVRPLTIGEKALLKTLPWKSINASATADMIKPGESMPKDMNISIGVDVIREMQNEQKFLTLSYGLSCRKKTMTVEKVKSMTVSDKVIDTLFEKILEISGVSIEDLKPFREITNRS
jgi:hypothetical protein